MSGNKLTVVNREGLIDGSTAARTERGSMPPDGHSCSRVERLFAPAAALFGKYWQSPLARASGYSQGHLQRVFTGRSAVTVEVEEAVLRAYREEISRLEQRTACARAGVMKILEAKEQIEDMVWDSQRTSAR